VEPILIVDDDRSSLELLTLHLEERGFGVLSAASGADGARLAARSQPSAIVLDMRLPDGSGIDLLPSLRSQAAESPVLVITAHHDASTTIEAMKAGAFDYLHKPLDLGLFDAALDRALDVRRRSRGAGHVPVSSAGPGELGMLAGLVGKARPMQQLFKELGQVAAARATVLIVGETGSGKELVARALHASQHEGRGLPFVAVNCSALVETLLESELFGHEKGAFTGATQSKPGRLELAGQGTLFLDEIGELPAGLQSKLLRVLQEREYERVGGTKALPLEARVVAATHRDLAAEVQAGRFRADLHQRLRVLTLRVPPLRERREDIPLLVEHLLSRLGPRHGRKTLKKVSRSAIALLQRRDWPGNVRELENVLTRAAVLCQGEVLLDEHVREALLAVEPGDLLSRGEPGPAPSAADPLAGLASLEEVERSHLTRVFELTGRHRGKTCAVLGISRPTLERKLRRWGLAD
jgi:two-component system response regulator AtoC